MATQAELANALIVAKQRLMHIVAGAVATAWHGLPHYDQAQVDQFLSAAVPIAAAGNQQTVALTEAFLAQALGVRPLGLDAEQIIAGIRNGVTPEQVYTRSFVTVWSALKNGTPWAQAVKMGLDRSTSAAATDVQLSFTHTLAAAGQASDRIVGYERVPDAGACDYCKAATGQIYHTSQLLPMHSWCGCGVQPVSEGDTHPFVTAPARFPGANGLEVAVHQHGELGPVLTNAADHFTGPAAVGHH